MKMIKDLIILFVIIVTTLIFAGYVGELYFQAIEGESSTKGLNFIRGLPLLYVFLLSFLFSAFGSNKKNILIGLLIIPAILFELYLDPTHVYIPFLLALVGWGIGLGISKVLPQNKTL